MTTDLCRSLTRGLAGLVGAMLVLAGASAAAQPPAAEQHTERASTTTPTEDSTDLKFQAGAQLQSGNTESYAVNGGVVSDVVRNRHAFHFDGLVAYGASAPADSDDVQRTARNINARARYDFYLTDMDALFAAIRYRWDTFAGLDSRIQSQVGYLRNFVREENHRFWMEVGYDLTWDSLFYIDAMTMVRTDDTAIVHAARGFLGWESTFNEHVKAKAGAESLFNLEEGEDVRVNGYAGVTASFTERFKLEVLFTVLFDNVPVPGNEKTDTTTIVSLIYDAI